jgi:uncharacterized protein
MSMSGSVPASSPLFPEVDEFSAPFYAAAADGRLLVQNCQECGRLRWTPRPMCPWCQGLDAGWTEVRPRGTVWSFCVVHPPVLPALADRVPFAVAVVELDDHPHVHMVGDIVGHDTASELQIGTPVQAIFERLTEDVGLVHWASLTARLPQQGSRGRPGLEGSTDA